MFEEGDFVPIENCQVSSAVPLGLVVIVGGRMVFISFLFIRGEFQSYALGDIVTLRVVRSYAERKRLIA